MTSSTHDPLPRSVAPRPPAYAGQEPLDGARRWGWVEGSARTLALAVLSGGLFGFLLQKGGAATFDILQGVLLIENFVVVKLMLSAITAGMIGFHVLERRHLLQARIQDTAYGSNIVGGLVFGGGFALLAYCPGTNFAAIGQGNYDALVGFVGLMLGSYLFALASRRWPRLSDLGSRGKLTLPGVLHVRRGAFVAIAVPVFVAALVGLEVYGP